MSEGRVVATVEGPVARVLFDRPDVHNAMTSAMYDQLIGACRRFSADRTVKVVVFSGAGGKAFVSGTDIRQLSAIAGSEDGLAYEARIDACVGALEALPQPTLALVTGWAVGGGLALAAACDLRLATADAKFGAPIARTVGNCYSPANVRRLIAGFGAPRAKRILMLADMIGAEEARSCGFVLDVVASDAIEERASQVIAALVGHAPLTMHAAKEMIRRLVQDEPSESLDLIAAVYGSDDFRAGVRAFSGKTKPEWRGH